MVESKKSRNKRDKDNTSNDDMDIFFDTGYLGSEKVAKERDAHSPSKSTNNIVDQEIAIAHLCNTSDNGDKRANNRNKSRQ